MSDAITNVTVLTSATSVISTSDVAGKVVQIYNASEEVITLTFTGSSGDTFGLAAGTPMDVPDGIALTATSVGGAAALVVLRGVRLAASGGAAAASTSSSAPAGAPGMWSVGQGDFTAVWASATTLTLGTFPTAMGTPISGRFFMVVETLVSGEQTVYVPTENEMLLSGQVLTVADATFIETTSTFDVFCWGPPRGYDASVNADQSQVLNPEWSHVATQQETATGQTDGTANDYYIDMEYYNEVTFQIVDTPGVAGTNTYTIGATATNDGTAAASCDYVDIGSSRFSAASWTTDAFEPASVPFRAKYLHINVARASDGGNSDGAWTINIMLGNS